MKLLLILATATLVAAGSRSYKRRTNVDYEDIETADNAERFDEPQRSDSRKSNRIGVYSHSIQVAKNKSQRRFSDASERRRDSHNVLSERSDSVASGTQFEGTHFGTYGGGAQVQQIHTHQLLTDQGLVPIYQNPGGHAHVQGPQQHLVLTSGLGVSGLGDAGGQLAQGPPILLAGGGQIGHPHQHAHAQLFANHQAIAQGPPPEADNELGSDITKSVYVFSAPPDPFDYAPRQTLTKLPQRPQKHYQVVFINAPNPPPPQQHHVELGPPPELKTLVYVLVKKPQPPGPINFIKPALQPHPHKPEVYFIRYKNRGAYGLTPSALGPVEESIHPGGHPGGHPGVQFAPVNPQEEIRGNIDYGPALSPQFDAPAHPYDLEAYHHQDDSHLSASQVLQHRSSNREVDAGVSGI